MPKANHSKSSTTKALEKATKDWRSAKKRERAARNALAAVVNEAVASGVMSENKVASVTAIPRMTIRKMLGKDELPTEAEAAGTDEEAVDAPSAAAPSFAAPSFVAVAVVEEAQAVEPVAVVADEVSSDDSDSDSDSGSDSVSDAASDADATVAAVDGEPAGDEPAGDEPVAPAPAFARPVTPTWASPPSSNFTT
jgi:hypothetical protein